MPSLTLYRDVLRVQTKVFNYGNLTVFVLKLRLSFRNHYDQTGKAANRNGSLHQPSIRFVVEVCLLRIYRNIS